MDAYFDIHGLFSIYLENPPGDAYNFLSKELGFFQSEPCKRPDIHILYLPLVELPYNAIQLLQDLYYCGGEVFLERNGRFLKYDIRNWLQVPVRVEVEAGFPHWWMFYALEKTMLISVVAKGYSVLHAGAVSRRGRATVISTLQTGGKTLYVLDRCAVWGDDFLGDDSVFIDGKGNCLCYPRGINFNRFHGEHYARAKEAFFRQISSWDCAKDIMRRWVHQLVNFALQRRAAACGFRLPVQAVYPDFKIAESARVEQLILKFAANGNKYCDGKWDNSRIVKFLRENVTWELQNHIAPYLAAIAAYGDEHVIEMSRSINSLRQKQLTIINAFINNVRVEFDYANVCR